MTTSWEKVEKIYWKKSWQKSWEKNWEEVEKKLRTLNFVGKITKTSNTGHLFFWQNLKFVNASNTSTTGHSEILGKYQIRKYVKCGRHLLEKYQIRKHVKYVCTSLGKPSKFIFGKSWAFGPTRGVWPKPKFLLKFSKINALENGQKCNETHQT